MEGMLSKDVAPVTLDAAKRMILATERHQLPASMVDPLRSDCAFFLDMDLAILGSAPDVFEAFQHAIRTSTTTCRMIFIGRAVARLWSASRSARRSISQSRSRCSSSRRRGRTSAAHWRCFELPQHSGTLTARPPREVSRYLDCMSAPVCFIVSTT